MSKTSTISARFSKDHITYLYRGLKSIGHTPKTMSDLVRLSTADWIQRVAPHVIHELSSNEDIAAVEQLMEGKKDLFKVIALTPKLIPAAKGKEIIDSTIMTSIPTKDQGPTARIVAAINSGVTIMQNLNSENSEIVRLTLQLCKVLPDGVLTKEETAYIAEMGWQVKEK